MIDPDPTSRNGDFPDPEGSPWRVEESLRLANQQLRLHFEQTPMAVIEWGLDFQVKRWNPAAETIFGFSREEALGRVATFIVPERFHDQVDGVWRALLEQAGGRRSTNWNIRKDGMEIFCEWYNTPLIDDEGTCIGVASLVLDDTVRTRAQQLLEWEKDALEWIVGGGSLAESLDGLIVDLEKQSDGMHGSVLLLDDDGVSLRLAAAPSLPEGYKGSLAGLMSCHGQGEVDFLELLLHPVIIEDIAKQEPCGDFCQLMIRHGLHSSWSVPILGDHGKPLGVLAIYHTEPRKPLPYELDLVARAARVTRIAIERKTAEEKIRSFNAELEQRVEARTRELEAFSYSVSHDLRAPLRAVDGFSRILASDHGEQLSDDGRRIIGVIRSETRRMGQLIDDLLTFSRLGRETIDPQPVDMRALAREVFDELAARSPSRQIRLELGDLPPAKGTESMIRLIWVNLIGNAIKFTKEREVGEIEIGAEDGGKAGPIYHVTDNGAGFDMRYSDKLFGVFQRLHSQEEFPGTGVGLALVQRIVQRHGGRVWAEAEPGRGATFFFTLSRQPL